MSIEILSTREQLEKDLEAKLKKTLDFYESNAASLLPPVIEELNHLQGMYEQYQQEPEKINLETLNDLWHNYYFSDGPRLLKGWLQKINESLTCVSAECEKAAISSECLQSYPALFAHKENLEQALAQIKELKGIAGNETFIAALFNLYKFLPRDPDIETDVPFPVIESHLIN